MLPSNIEKMIARERRISEEFDFRVAEVMRRKSFTKISAMMEVIQDEIEKNRNETYQRSVCLRLFSEVKDGQS